MTIHKMHINNFLVDNITAGNARVLIFFGTNQATKRCCVKHEFDFREMADLPNPFDCSDRLRFQ